MPSTSQVAGVEVRSGLSRLPSWSKNPFSQVFGILAWIHPCAFIRRISNRRYKDSDLQVAGAIAGAGGQGLFSSFSSHSKLRSMAHSSCLHRYNRSGSVFAHAHQKEHLSNRASVSPHHRYQWFCPALHRNRPLQGSNGSRLVCC